MVIEKVFQQLKEQDRKLTKKRFCNEYLGKSESYYYVMKYLNKEASNDALLKCYVGLKKAADELEENGFVNINYHNNKKFAEMVLEQIGGKVAKEL